MPPALPGFSLPTLMKVCAGLNTKAELHGSELSAVKECQIRQPVTEIIDRIALCHYVSSFA